MFNPSQRTASRARLTAPARRAAAVLFEPIERRVLMSAAGQPDPAFGTNGTATDGAAAAVNGGSPVAQAVQPDGKIVVESNTANKITLTRFNADGSVDASFGTAGVASDAYLPAGVSSVYLESTTSSESVLVQSDGKLIVTGTIDPTAGTHAYYQHYFAVRFDANGSVDTTYDANSAYDFQFQSPSANERDWLYSSVLGTDGKLYLVGESNTNLSILRLNTDGTVDTSYGFAHNGSEVRVQSNPDGLPFVRAAIDSGDRLVIAGSVQTTNAGGYRVPQFAVTRLNYNGSQDGTFAGYKLAVSAALPAGEEFDLGGVTIDPAGNILVDADFTGTQQEDGATGYAVARFTPTGAVDPTFGNGTGLVSSPRVTATSGPTFGTVSGIAADAAGDPLISSFNDTERGAAAGGASYVTRLTTTGALDATFGTGGSVGLGFTAIGVDYDPTTDGGTVVTAGSGVSATRLLDPSTPTPTGTTLTGTLIGSTGSYQNDGDTIANAVDGNANTFYDGYAANGDWVGFDLPQAAVVSSVAFTPRAGYAGRMVGGVFQGSNSPQFTTGVVNLYTVATAPASGVLKTEAVNVATPFRYVRYLSPNGSEGNVAEVQFIGEYTATESPATQLSGVIIGTAGSYRNQGSTIGNAEDGLVSTFFDGPTANGNFVGLDLGTQQQVDAIAFAPRTGYDSRMVGGEFQVSTSADFSTGVTTVYTFTAAPADGKLTTVTLPFQSEATGRYVRYLSPNGSEGDVAEVQFFE